MNLTFNELRRIKDSLPDGSVARIATDLGISQESVRNYFGGENYRSGNAMGVHYEQGPDGGLVRLDDLTILNKARQIIDRDELLN